MIKNKKKPGLHLVKVNFSSSNLPDISKEQNDIKSSQYVHRDLINMHKDINSMFTTSKPELKNICEYYFDGSGKSIRPLIICSMARALNVHYMLNFHPNQKIEPEYVLMDSQKKIAHIAEMIHVASLIHDDIVDASDLRRGKPSVNLKWGPHKATLAGDYVLAVSSKALAELGSTRVVETLSTVLEDLVKGELMQFGTKENDNERFEHYSVKTYRKTASLIANSCKAVAILLVEKNGTEKTEKIDEELVKKAYECGKNIGVAFQLIDDVLDFTSHSEKLGKPGAGADLRLGLATAPVLFASAKYPELNAMIMRRFANEGDVLKAFNFVIKSDGIKETRFLAKKYCQNALSILNTLKPSSDIDYLKYLIHKVINREK